MHARAYVAQEAEAVHRHDLNDRANALSFKGVIRNDPEDDDDQNNGNEKQHFREAQKKHFVRRGACKYPLNNRNYTKKKHQQLQRYKYIFYFLS
jgi:hypothetical protein